MDGCSEPTWTYSRRVQSVLWANSWRKTTNNEALEGSENLVGNIDVGVNVLDVIQDFRTGQDALRVSEDLMVAFQQEDGFTRMTLTDQAGLEVGNVEIHGTGVDPLSDLLRSESPDPSGAGGDLL